MLDSDDTKSKFRFSLDFGPLRRLFRTGIKPRTLLIAALALFLIVATVYAAISYPTLFSPTGPQQNQPGQFGPGSTDRTSVPTAGANSPAVPLSSGDAADGTEVGANEPVTPPATTASADDMESDAAAGAEPEVQPTLAAPAAPTALAWPLRGKTLTSFGIVWSVTLGDWRQHDGIDILAAEGVSVTAAADGIVTASEKRSDTGVTVVIDHGGGVSTVYGCLLVTGRKAGDRVKTGDEIGKTGNSGMSELALDSHLHFEVRRAETAISPGDWLK